VLVYITILCNLLTCVAGSRSKFNYFLLLSRGPRGYFYRSVFRSTSNCERHWSMWLPNYCMRLNEFMYLEVIALIFTILQLCMPSSGCTFQLHMIYPEMKIIINTVQVTNRLTERLKRYSEHKQTISGSTGLQIYNSPLDH
jgi:hypothetical protein